MKKSVLKLILLLLAVPIMFIGCKKSDSIYPSANSDNSVKSEIAYCGTPETYHLFYHPNSASVQTLPFPFDIGTPVGNVIVGNDGVNLYVTVNITNPDLTICDSPWAANRVQMFVGSRTGLLAPNISHDLDAAGSGGVGTGGFYYNNFPYQMPVLGDGNCVTTYTFPPIAKASLPDTSCYFIVVGVQLYSATNAEFYHVTAKSAAKNAGYYVKYCWQNCSSCNTVYARNDQGVQGTNLFCFYNAPLNLSNWGWTMKIDPPVAPATSVSISWPLYAGNPDCAPMHDPVGVFEGTYNGSTLHVRYALNPGYSLDETHLWVGKATNAHPYLYWKNNKYVAAPGNYTYNNIFVAGQYKDIPATGTLYIAAHGKVCGVFPW